MTLTEAQTQFNALSDRLSATKAAQKAALVALGRTPTDVWDTYPGELRAVTGGSGTYQDSKTVTADPAGMTITPDEGYSGMLKAIIAAEPNFQPWNLVDGIQAWGITGTAKPAVSTDPPTNLPVDKDDADTAYEGQTGAAPAETDYFVCADNNGNITYWYLSESFEITSYNPINTDFAAKGAVRLAYHTTGENAGQWTFDDFTSEASAGENYLKNIRYCTREKLYYNDVEIWPNMLYKQSLADSSWATISQISKSGNAESYYSIGDEKDIELTNGETLTLRIIGFNHDVLSDGTGYSGITFETKHLMSSTLSMNSSNTNVGGWRESAMRTRLQPGGSIYNALPQEVQDVIRPVNKVTSVGNAGTALETTNDYCFLLSEVEIFGSTTYSVAGEGKQYDYYSSYATTAAKRVKYLSNGSGSAIYWWERSPLSSASTGFCLVRSDGIASYGIAVSSGGVSFGFCV